MKHLLIEKALIYDVPETIENTSGHKYDAKKGYWVCTNNDTPSIYSENFRPPRSKKADIETGEDKKGE